MVTTPIMEEVLHKIYNFLDSIDKPGAILALYDEGKLYARASIYRYPIFYAKLIEYVFQKTQYIKIRVGGYSHRAYILVYRAVDKNPEFKERVEFTENLVKSTKFDKDSDFIKRADEYDFKGFDGHSCVYYYINDIVSGFTNSDGKFFPFYDAKSKGRYAITDVIMAIGYKNIPPATAAIHTFSTTSSGDMLIYGGKTTKKKCRGQSRKDLFEEFHLPYLDIHKLLPSKETLNCDFEQWEQMEEETTK